MENSIKVAIWILVIAVVLYLVVQEVRYEQCVRGFMENPYAKDWLAIQACK